MDTRSPPTCAAQSNRQRGPGFHPGDLVLLETGQPMLCEVLRVEDGGLIRIRGAGWPSGYSVLVSIQEVRHVTGILGGKRTDRG